MEIKRIIQIVRDSYFNGPEFYFNRPSNRFIYEKINGVRNMLLKKRLNDMQTVSTDNYQTICIDIEEQKCDCDSCKKFGGKIPNILVWNDGYAISGIYTKGGKKITFVEPNLIKEYIDSSFFNVIGNIATIENSNIYIYGNDIIETIKVTAIFQDPIYINECGIDICYPYIDMEYPMQEDLLHYAISLAFSKNDNKLEQNNGNDKKNN